MAEINLSPYTAEYEAMLRRRRLAEAMMQQAQAPGTPNNEMAGGYVIRKSPFEGLAKMLQAGVGGYMANKADQEVKDLALKREGDQRSDMSALMGALQGTAPGKPEIPVPADELGGGPGRAAQPGTGVLAPDFMSNLKTPEARQHALAVALQFAGPKTPIKIKDDESLINPTTGATLRQGTIKPEFGQPQYEMIDGVEHAVVYDKQGNRKVVGPATRQNQFNTGTVDARLNREQAQRQWDNMSASQRADYDIRGRQLGISGAQLFFETGMQPPGSPLPAPPGIPPQPFQGGAAPPQQPLPGSVNIPRSVTPFLPPGATTNAPSLAQIPSQVQRARDGDRLAILLQERALQQQAGRIDPALDAEIAQMQGRTPIAAAPSGGGGQLAATPGIPPKIAAQNAGKIALQQQENAQNLPSTLSAAERAVKQIDELVGSADGKIKPHAGFNSAVGFGVPGLKYVPGTDTASFHARLDQLKGGAFLEAFESLKGGGQITEVEGRKATQAITRMDTATTEKEFVTAAREFQEVIRAGMDKARRAAGQQVAPRGQAGATGTWGNETPSRRATDKKWNDL